jgi:hypothetical protein
MAAQHPGRSGRVAAAQIHDRTHVEATEGDAMNKRYPIVSIRIVALLVACALSRPALAAVSASLDRSNIGSGETVQLQLQYDGSTDSQPDLGPLKQDFEVLGSGRGSNVQIINGHMSTQTQLTVLLSPRHDGRIEIPPLQWGGQQSPALELTVGGGSSARSGAQSGAQSGTQTQGDAAHVFVSATLDQKQPYVQAADVLTVRLYTDQPLNQASLDLPGNSDVLVRQIGKDRQSSETRNGRSYQVVERRYLLFPQRSGKLSLDGPVLDAQVPDTRGNDPFGNPAFGNIFRQMPFAGMMGATRPLRVHGKPVELNVRPRPANVTGAYWLPAQKVTLEESWSPDGNSIYAGEPLTRHLHISAVGLTGAQLPDPAALVAVPDGVKAYPDQSKAGDAIQGDTVTGSRDQDVALIAASPGHIELPAVRLNWWDTAHDTLREITLPARTLEILSAAAGNAVATLPAAASPAASGGPDFAVRLAAEQKSGIATAVAWLWVSVALALLWLLTLLAWWYTRKRARQPHPQESAAQDRPETIDAGTAFNAFKQACRDNDPHAARRQLIAWAGSAWPAPPPAGLNQLSQRLGDPGLAEALRQLDRACYTGSPWLGAALLGMLPVPPAPASPAQSRHELPELYP